MNNALILKELLSHLRISIAKFEQEIGVGKSTIDRAINRNSKLSLTIVGAITQRYPEVNREWLLTGQGPMILVTPTSVHEDGATYTTKSEKLEKHLKDGDKMMSEILSPASIKDMSDEDIELFSEYRKLLLKLHKRTQQKNAG